MFVSVGKLCMFAKCVSKQCKVVQLQCHLSRVLFVLSPLSFTHQNFVLKGTIAKRGEMCWRGD